MTQKVYKTANGKTVDLGAIMLQNENTVAVGNMGVNARGDEVAPAGVVASRAKVVADRIDDQVKTPRHGPVPTSRRTAQDTEGTSE